MKCLTCYWAERFFNFSKTNNLENVSSHRCLFVIVSIVSFWQFEQDHWCQRWECHWILSSLLVSENKNHCPFTWLYVCIEATPCVFDPMRFICLSFQINVWIEWNKKTCDESQATNLLWEVWSCTKSSTTMTVEVRQLTMLAGIYFVRASRPLINQRRPPSGGVTLSPVMNCRLHDPFET